MAHQQAAAAEQAAAEVRQHVDRARADLDEVRERAGQLRESLATITAERDAARAEVERERAHGDQRVSDLHETYTRQIADLRGHAADTNEPPPQARRARIKRPSSDAG